MSDDHLHAHGVGKGSRSSTDFGVSNLLYFSLSLKRNFERLSIHVKMKKISGTLNVSNINLKF